MPIDREGVLLPGEPQFERHAHGAMISNGVEIGHTLQCPHCGAHFLSIKGSGARRGYCYHCNAVLCGKLVCMTCVPFEKMQELLEKG